MNDKENILRPAYAEWMHWTGVVIERLSTCVQIYSNPPHKDVFLPQIGRQFKTSQTVDLLRHIFTLADSQTPVALSVQADHAQHDDQIIGSLISPLTDVLRRLPELSGDMQKLLKSPWQDKCNGRLANELFRGPNGIEAEGIGSGYTADGRLPQKLQDLLEREQMGDTRPLRIATEAEMGLEPHRHDDEVSRRWGEKNSRSLRSAGRVD